MSSEFVNKCLLKELMRDEFKLPPDCILDVDGNGVVVVKKPLLLVGDEFKSSPVIENGHKSNGLQRRWTEFLEDVSFLTNPHTKWRDLGDGQHMAAMRMVYNGLKIAEDTHGTIILPACVGINPLLIPYNKVSDKGAILALNYWIPIVPPAEEQILGKFTLNLTNSTGKVFKHRIPYDEEKYHELFD